MAIPLKLEDLMLDGNIVQPPIDHGPFLVTYYPRRRYPENIITSFRYHSTFGRIAYSLEEVSYGEYSFSLTTKQDEIFLEEEKISGINKRLLQEAKKIDAMALACVPPFDRAPALGMAMNAILRGTFDFMLKYYSYQRYLLYSHIENLTKGVHGNNGG